MSAFYNNFIRPLSTDTDQAEREVVLNYLLVGFFVLGVIALLDTLLAPVISQEAPLWGRVLNNVLVLLFIAGLYGVARYKGLHKLVGALLTALITAMSGALVYHWSIWLPTGLLLFCLSIVVAGVLIGARYSVYVTCLIIAVLAYLQHGQSIGHLHPDLNWIDVKPTPGDVIGFSAILLVIALVSWLFNRQMELSLRRAQRSERALQRQKELLEVKVEKRAQQLAAAQLEKMQELYRFAELGQLSTSLFHDLANHLSTVSVDIEGLSAREQSDIMRRISQNIGHIDTIVKRVREQIGGRSVIETFNVLHEIEEVRRILMPAAEQAHVAVTVERDRSIKDSLRYKGDIIRFRQIILNLITNGIESYPTAHTPSPDARPVTVRLERQQAALIIEVSDKGPGIPRDDRTRVFRPFYTTKKRGVGIGLFIVKQVVENDFGGTITISGDEQKGTVMTVVLPKSFYGRP